MASLSVIYWRDIPAQVVAESGRGRDRVQSKQEMPKRFALAIDEAAMRGGSSSTDDYLAEWRKSDPEPISDDMEQMEQAVSARIEELDSLYDKARLSALVANGGRDDSNE